MSEKKLIYCDKCDLPLDEQRVHFRYLGHAFHAQLPRCPGCGQVYIDEKMVKGRIAQVEMELEDK